MVCRQVHTWAGVVSNYLGGTFPYSITVDLNFQRVLYTVHLYHVENLYIYDL